MRREIYKAAIMNIQITFNFNSSAFDFEIYFGETFAICKSPESEILIMT